jgi:excisionase family DNA binding protein
MEVMVMGDFGGWITTAEAARLTGYSISHLRYMAREGLVPTCRVGTAYLFDRAALEAYKERMERLGTKKFDPTRGQSGVE